MLDKNHKIFTAQVKQLASSAIADGELLQKCLDEKASTRCTDEALKPLASYRTFELTQMYANFYGNDAYHRARRNFVYKINACTKTPDNIALHRRQSGLIAKLSRGSLYHFVWQDIYQTGDDAMDNQHKDVFVLADLLLSITDESELGKQAQQLYQQVKEHFAEEEEQMAHSEFQYLDRHRREHHVMLENLEKIVEKIRYEQKIQPDIQAFMDKWGKHILHSDQMFRHYLHQMVD